MSLGVHIRAFKQSSQYVKQPGVDFCCIKFTGRIWVCGFGEYKAIAKAEVEHVAVTRVAKEEKGLTNLRDRQRRQA